MSTVEATQEVKDAIATEYRCPYCDFSEKTERAIRSHITRADDAAHDGHNGFSPSVVVEGPEGEKIKFTNSQNVGEVTSNLISSNVPEDKVQIVAYAFQHPNAGYAEVHRKAGGDYSYATVRNTVKEYVEAVLSPKTTTTRSTKSYEDLSERQQAAVDAIAANPLSQNSALREDGITEESSGYLSSIRHSHRDIILERIGHFHGTEEVREVVKEVEIPAESGISPAAVELVRIRLESIANVTTDGGHRVAREALSLLDEILDKED
jgi:hypothetical protein